MEAADPGARQSASTSANNPDSHLTPPQQSFPSQSFREPFERPHHELPAMATATVLQPSSTTTNSYPPPSSYPSTYLPPASNMSSSAEPRRSPEEKEAPSTRQSLPSISEVISKTSTQYPAPAPPPAAQPSSSFPSPFSGPPRSYAEADKHASSQGAPPGPPPYGARREPLPSFNESPRTAFNARPGVPALSDRRNSPSIKAEYSHPYAHDAHKDPRTVNGAYPHAAAPPPPPSNSYPSAPLPQGQMPLPSYPPSPRHGHQQNYPNFDQRGQSSHVEDGERGQRPPFEAPIYSAPWSYGETLGRLAQSARTTYTFAEAYGRIAQEQHGAQPIPERLPTEQELTDILSNHEMQRAALERLREVVAQSIRNERAREPPKPKLSYPDEQDVPMFEDGAKAHYNITEVKKRRGRAAPPGRCHSCNRVDTPEWRRGPDGARTLCNACGLHYAKLERKRQLEQRNIRPKMEERN